MNCIGYLWGTCFSLIFWIFFPSVFWKSHWLFHRLSHGSVTVFWKSHWFFWGWSSWNIYVTLSSAWGVKLCFHCLIFSIMALNGYVYFLFFSKFYTRGMAWHWMDTCISCFFQSLHLRVKWKHDIYCLKNHQNNVLGTLFKNV